MKDLKTILNENYIIEAANNITLDDKYKSGKDQKWIDWMIKRSTPKSGRDLNATIEKYCNQFGWDSDLNWINVSKVTDMSEMFANQNAAFTGDISKWDTSNVENMYRMFHYSDFNGDISNWNVSKVKVMADMFSKSKFASDLSKWDVSNVENMYRMFDCTKFNRDISRWDVRNVENMEQMFSWSDFNQDLSRWNIKKVKNTTDMFYQSPLEKRPPKWYVSK